MIDKIERDGSSVKPKPSAMRAGITASSLLVFSRTGEVIRSLTSEQYTLSGALSTEKCEMCLDEAAHTEYSLMRRRPAG